jgi:MED6 mediator sub complex component
LYVLCVYLHQIEIAGHENALHLSWHDSGWIHSLNSTNVMDYFSERSNPFYDRQCNNEIIKMQRLNSEQLKLVFGSILLFYMFEMQICRLFNVFCWNFMRRFDIGS